MTCIVEIPPKADLRVVLLTIINDILDFSKIEAGKLIFELLDFDLVATVESTLDMLSETAYEKGIELACEIAPNVHSRLRGDPGRLRQVLINLAGNAVKFTPEGEVVVRVTVASQTDTNAMLRFEIQDTGIGIAPEAQRALFQPFSQVDSSTTRKYGGTGLGLAISKHLVAIMGGEIGVDSESTKGSKFWFTARFEKQLASMVIREIRDVAGLRVLVVDDNATNRQILLHQLLAWKMQPDCASSGEEALSIALSMMREAASKGKPYCFVLLDFQMPEMDGLALACAIKSDPIIGSARLIMLTSRGQLLSPTELHDLHIDSCLIKPVKQGRLLECMIDGTNRVVTRTSPGKVFPLTPLEFPLPVTQPLQERRILLADDSRTNRSVTLAQLHILGFAADAVETGLEAINALEKVSYDVILMDCQMPVLDGYEATQTIRKREQALDGPCPWKAPVHIIALTAHVIQGEREKCLAAGMDDYLPKPIRLPDLEEVLERAKHAVRT